MRRVYAKREKFKRLVTFFKHLFFVFLFSRDEKGGKVDESRSEFRSAGRQSSWNRLINWTRSWCINGWDAISAPRQCTYVAFYTRSIGIDRFRWSIPDNRLNRSWITSDWSYVTTWLTFLPLIVGRQTGSRIVHAFPFSPSTSRANNRCSNRLFKIFPRTFISKFINYVITKL